MLSVRDLANAMLNLGKYREPSVRERIARGETVYAPEVNGASASTRRKWQRTFQAREHGRLK